MLHQRTLTDSYGEDSQNHVLDLEQHLIDEKKESSLCSHWFQLEDELSSIFQSVFNFEWVSHGLWATTGKSHFDKY